MSRFVISSVEISDQGLELRLACTPSDAVTNLPAQAPLIKVEWDVPSGRPEPSVIRRADLKSVAAGGFKTHLVLPGEARDAVLRGVGIAQAKGGAELRLDESLRSQLLRIFPETDDEYVSSFQSNKKRWGGRRTRFFVFSQILRFYRGAPEHRVGAALVMAYKAVEIGNADLVREALDAVDTAETLLPRLPLDWHPRRNREHLEISLLCARWHLEAAQGDEDAVLRTIRRVHELCQSRASYWTLAFSASKSLLFGGWLLWRSGRAEGATAYWERCVSLFKQAVHEADACRPVLFGELAHSLEAAHVAGTCLSALKKPDSREMPNREQILAASARVSEKFHAQWPIGLD